MTKNTETPDKFIQHAKVMKALAHPTRLFIVDELSKGDRCVCELTDMIGADISTVSKHLAVLKKTGLLEDRKEGSKVFYSLVAPCALKFFDCIDSVMQNRTLSKNKRRVCNNQHTRDALIFPNTDV